MILNLIFSNLNAIVLFVWIILWIFVAFRYFYPNLLKNISFLKLALMAFLINVFYGIFITWGQYYVWFHATNFTKNLVKLPLPKEVPIYSILRPLFENNLGYFFYYILGRFWFYIFILFIVSFLLYFVIKIWENYRGNFSKDSPELILTLMLISGWPGIFIFIPLGFIVSILYFIFCYIKGQKKVQIEPVFVFVSLLTLIFSKVIFIFFK